MLFVAVSLVLTFAGCGEPSHGDRVPLSGTVKTGGELLQENATIYFDPMGETGIGSSGEVSGGRFAIPEESGLTPGRKYQVTVITAPGIPAEGTPRDQIKIAQRFETTLEVPPREVEESPELEIVFE